MYGMFERERTSRVHTGTQAAVLAQPRRPFLHPSCALSTVFASATSFIFRAARSFEPFALSGCHLPTTHASPQRRVDAVQSGYGALLGELLVLLLDPVALLLLWDLIEVRRQL